MSLPLVEIAFAGELIHWGGPAPFFFVAVPEEHVGAVREAARQASYGWGCVPGEAEADGVAFTTSLFPKDGGYMVPIKAAVRKQMTWVVQHDVNVRLRIRPQPGLCRSVRI